MPQLYLIGTAHHDPQGYERLDTLLREIRPEIITFEGTFEEITLMHAIDMMRADPALRRRLIALRCAENPGMLHETASFLLDHEDFECRAIRNYCEETGVALIPLEPRRLSQGLMRRINAEYQNILRQTPEALVRLSEEQYATDDLSSCLPEFIALCEQGDAETGLFLRGCQKRKRVAHVTGVHHLFGGYNNLYEQLKTLSPTRIKLCDAPSFTLDQPCGLHT